jgi:hypothetical protein
LLVERVADAERRQAAFARELVTELDVSEAEATARKPRSHGCLPRARTRRAGE